MDGLWNETPERGREKPNAFAWGDKPCTTEAERASISTDAKIATERLAFSGAEGRSKTDGKAPDAFPRWTKYESGFHCGDGFMGIYIKL